jgi:prefoldin subunit 5
MVKFYQDRIEAMTKHIKKLEGRISSLEAQIEINNKAYYE